MLSECLSCCRSRWPTTKKSWMEVRRSRWLTGRSIGITLVGFVPSPVRQETRCKHQLRTRFLLVRLSSLSYSPLLLKERYSSPFSHHHSVWPRCHKISKDRTTLIAVDRFCKLYTHCSCWSFHFTVHYSRGGCSYVVATMQRDMILIQLKPTRKRIELIEM